MQQFGQWRYECDRDATAAAHAQATAGGASTCSCSGCRNFVAVREGVFPAEFRTLLDALGIDPAKDGEVYHVARTGPGLHLYGGWYHFVGALHTTGDFAEIGFGQGFFCSMCVASAPPIETLVGLPVVQLEFRADGIPWVLDEPEPD